MPKAHYEICIQLLPYANSKRFTINRLSNHMWPSIYIYVCLRERERDKKEIVRQKLSLERQTKVST